MDLGQKRLKRNNRTRRTLALTRKSGAFIYASERKTIKTINAGYLDDIFLSFVHSCQRFISVHRSANNYHPILFPSARWSVKEINLFPKKMRWHNATLFVVCAAKKSICFTVKMNEWYLLFTRFRCSVEWASLMVSFLSCESQKERNNDEINLQSGQWKKGDFPVWSRVDLAWYE